jgi:hypothetical protein
MKKNLSVLKFEKHKAVPCSGLNTSSYSRNFGLK